MPPCLTLSIIRYGSRVKWRNPGKGVEPSPTPWCSSYWKGSLRVTLDYGRQLYLLTVVKSVLEIFKIAGYIFIDTAFTTFICYDHELANTVPPPTNPWFFLFKNGLLNQTFYYFWRASSSSCRAASANILDPLSSFLPIIHRLWQVFRATSHILI